MRLRPVVFVLGALAGALVLADASAAPPRTAPAPAGPQPTSRKLVRPPPRLTSRLAQRVQKNGASLTRKEILDKFDPDEVFDLGAGTKVTVQELLDRVDEAEGEQIKRGSSLTRLKKASLLRPGTATKRAAQKAALPAEVQQHEKMRPRLGSVASPCMLTTCVPAEKEKSIRWEKQKGDEDTIGVYTSFSVSEQTPDGDNTKCSATWDNGVHLLGSKHSLIKLTAEANGQKRPQPTAAGRAALYVLGQASPTWSKDGKAVSASLDRTFKTPSAKVGIDFIPLVSVEGGIASSATLSLKPTISANAEAGSAGCTIGFTPRLAADVDPQARIVVGIRKLVELAEGGLKANITVLDLSVPTTLGVKATEQPFSLSLKFKSDVKASYLKGKVVAWYRIKDICKWGFCLLEDGLGIDTSGEIELWEDADGIPYATNLVDIDGNVPFQSPQKAAAMAR